MVAKTSTPGYILSGPHTGWYIYLEPQPTGDCLLLYSNGNYFEKPRRRDSKKTVPGEVGYDQWFMTVEDAADWVESSHQIRWLDEEVQVKQFIGTWRLISQDTHFPDGRIEPSRGKHPQGILMYDAAGNMAVQLMRTDDRAGDYTDFSQLATAMEGYHAYFGTYEVDKAKKIVRHHVIGAAYLPYRGTVQVRHYDFDDDLLTLSADGPEGTLRVLVWERVS
ncbi:MAG: hypothetical protein BroJett018_33700 [Chloroflexota bacterium]|nr:MAG: hypothetical protein BroJett018_33700 [Chloroflexota bacterium]